MKRGERIPSVVWGCLQLLWGIINLPLVLFGALMSLVRTLIGLLLLFGLGIFAYDFYTEYQARVSTHQPRSTAGGEARRDRARAHEKALDGRAAPIPNHKPVSIRSTWKSRIRGPCCIPCGYIL